MVLPFFRLAPFPSFLPLHYSEICHKGGGKWTGFPPSFSSLQPELLGDCGAEINPFQYKSAAGLYRNIFLSHFHEELNRTRWRGRLCCKWQKEPIVSYNFLWANKEFAFPRLLTKRHTCLCTAIWNLFTACVLNWIHGRILPPGFLNGISFCILVQIAKCSHIMLLNFSEAVLWISYTAENRCESNYCSDIVLAGSRYICMMFDEFL